MQTRWRLDPSDDRHPVSQPVLDDGIAWLTWGDERGDEGQPIHIRAVSLGDGATVWQHDTQQAGAQFSFAPPTIAGDRLLQSCLGGVLCLDRTSGDPVWRCSLKEAHLLPPVVDGSRTFAAAGKELVVLDDEGVIRRRRRYRVKWLEHLVLHPDYGGFLATASSRVLRIDLESLEVMQTYELPGRWAIGAPPVVWQDQLIVDPWGAYVVAFDIGTGEVAWRKKKKVGRLGRAVVLGDDLFYTTPRAEMIALGSCRRRWCVDEPVIHFDLDGEHVFALVITEDRRFEVLVVELSTGKVARRIAAGDAPPMAQTRDLWLDEGLAVHDGVLVSSHLAGSVVRLEIGG
jgi:outer membrane protein assembly factor BamB